MTKKISLPHLFAGILFAVLTLGQLYNIFRLKTLYGINLPSMLSLLPVLSIPVFLLTAVCLFIGAFLNRQNAPAKVLPLIGLGALALLQMVNLFNGFRNGSYTAYDYVYYSPTFNPPYVLPRVLPRLVDLLGHTALLILAAVVLLSKKSRLRVLLFLPALLVLISYFITPVTGFLFQRLFDLIWSPGMFRFSLDYISILFFNAVYVAAVLLAGLGCAFPAVPDEKQAVPYSGPVPDPVYAPGSAYVPGPGYVLGPGYAPGLVYTPAPAYTPGPAQDAPSKVSAGVVEELKRYKELLDADVITQEEFDGKKKQLLNL